jgi:hypothetical protein
VTSPLENHQNPKTDTLTEKGRDDGNVSSICFSDVAIV